MPEAGQVFAPVNGTVTVVYPTGHAYGLLGDDGVEILIHIGVDTVSMNGDGFETVVTQNQHVRAGEVLGTFDTAKIKAAGLDEHVMVIVTNTAQYHDVQQIANQSVTAGDPLLAAQKESIA